MVYSEDPGFTAFVDDRRADVLGIQSVEDLPQGLYSAPLDVHISITSRCNLKCPGCYTYNGSQPPVDMTLDTATKVLNHLAAMNVFTVALGGGEPLLHPHVIDIARLARSREIVPNITTNGLLVDRTTAKECRIFGCLHLSCHNVGELGRLSDAVGCLREHRITPGLNLLVSSDTLGHLDTIGRWCSEHKITRVLFLRFKLTDNNRDCCAMALTPAQQQDLFPTIKRLSRKYHLMPMLDCSFFPVLVHHSVKKRDLEFFDVSGCLGGSAYLAVTADGRYKPCSFWHATYGEATSLDRNTWVDSVQLQTFRGIRKLESCARCKYIDLCNGGCRVCDNQGCQAETPAPDSSR